MGKPALRPFPGSELWKAARVESDALNFFMPFRRLEPNHGNQLTRALLVVLRLSPMAHAAWLRLVARDLDLQRLPAAGFHTQTRSVRSATDEDEPAEFVSVFLTPEAPLSGGGVITESDRSQVLDAVIDYGGELLMVIENKVAEDDARQARELICQPGARVRLADGQEAVVVLWRDVLETLIALRERNLVAGAEAAVLDDFLLYTEDHFPDLGPFRTLSLAHGNRFRQSRRLRQLLGEAVDLDAVIDLYGPYIETPAGDAIGAKTYLRMTDNETEVGFALYPADTLSQARAFYTRPTVVSGCLRCASAPAGTSYRTFTSATCSAASVRRPRPGTSTSTSGFGPTKFTRPARSPAPSGTTIGRGWRQSASPPTGPPRIRPALHRDPTPEPRRRVRVCRSRDAGRSPKRRLSTAVARCTHRFARRSTLPWRRSASHRSVGSHRCTDHADAAQSDRGRPTRGGPAPLRQ